MGLNHNDVVRVRVGHMLDQDGLVVNLYKDVNGSTFVYEGERGGLWLKITEGEVHRPSYTFPGLVSERLVEAFEEHSGHVKELLETRGLVAKYSLESVRLGRQLHVSEQQVATLLNVVDSLSVTLRGRKPSPD